MAGKGKWFYLHRSTVCFGLLFLVAHTLVSVPAVYIEASSTRCGSCVEAFQHGWPFVHMFRIDNKYSTGPKEDSYHQATLDNVVFGPWGIQRPFGAYQSRVLPIAGRGDVFRHDAKLNYVYLRFWREGRNWHYFGNNYTCRWKPMALLANLAVAFFMLLSSCLVFEFLRRRLRQFIIRDLFVLITLAAFVIAWGIQIRQECEDRAGFAKEIYAAASKNSSDLHFSFELFHDPNGPVKSPWYQAWVRRLFDGCFDPLARDPNLRIELVDRAPVWSGVDIEIYMGKNTEASDFFSSLNHPGASGIGEALFEFENDKQVEIIEHVPSTVNSLCLYRGRQTAPTLEIEADALNRFSKLEQLVLWDIGLSGIPEPMRKLERIQTHGFDQEMAEWIGSLPNLQTFDGDARYLEYLNPEIVELSINIGDPMELDLEALSNFRNLRFLTLEFDSGSSFEFDGTLPIFEKLETVHFSCASDVEHAFMTNFLHWLDRNPNATCYARWGAPQKNGYFRSAEWQKLKSRYARFFE